jgi:transcriptional regulator with XRE-family HTH domain
LTNLSTQLKRRRTKLGLNQTDVADALKISRTTYTHWENGKYQPDVEQLVNLADLFDTSLDLLVGRYENT